MPSDGYAAPKAGPYAGMPYVEALDKREREVTAGLLDSDFQRGVREGFDQSRCAIFNAWKNAEQSANAPLPEMVYLSELAESEDAYDSDKIGRCLHTLERLHRSQQAEHRIPNGPAEAMAMIREFYYSIAPELHIVQPDGECAHECNGCKFQDLFRAYDEKNRAPAPDLEHK